jgi:hypothetical protein
MDFAAAAAVDGYAVNAADAADAADSANAVPHCRRRRHAAVRRPPISLVAPAPHCGSFTHTHLSLQHHHLRFALLTPFPPSAAPCAPPALAAAAAKMFRGMFLALERLSHAPDAMRAQVILGSIGGAFVLSYFMYATSTRDNGSRERRALKVQQELKIHMK